MMQFVIDRISKAKTKKEKIEILQNFTNNRDKEVFRLCYDTDVTFGIKFHASEINLDILSNVDDEMLTILDNLSKRFLTGKNARDTVEKYCANHGDLLKAVCNKKIGFGLSQSVLNEAFGKGFLPEFNIQLAKDIPLSEVKFPCYAQPKFDGIRLIAYIPKNGTPKFRSRNGKYVEFDKIPDDIAKLQALITEDMIIDGELIYEDGRQFDAEGKELRTKITGYYNEAVKGGKPIPLDEPIYFAIFDCMTQKEFNTQKCDKTFKERSTLLGEICKNSGIWVEVENKGKTERVWQADFFTFCTTVKVTESSATNLFDTMFDAGFEGLILKHEDSKYEFKKNKQWAKMKKVDTADLEVVGFEEGDGMHAGAVGALNCVGHVEDKLVKVKVGSGLTHELRQLNEDGSCPLVGKVIEVAYNVVQENSAKDGHTLFLPRFKRIREDKS